MKEVYWLGFATFHKTYLNFLKFAEENQDSIQIVLRPHPLLFSNMYKFDAENFMHFLNVWNNLPNTSIDTEWDYIKSFEWSDLLITDGISFLAEYPLTRKNLIFFENLSHYPFNMNGNICVKCTYIAHDFNEVTDFVVQAMHGLLKPKSKELDNLIKHLSLKNDVSNLIVNDILESLD